MADRKQILDLFAQYREETEQRIADGIETYRKGDAVITVLGEKGQPLPGVAVKATQKNHAFRFGANIFMLEEFAEPEKNETYKQRFAELFNMATVPFYWNTLEPERGKPRYEKDSPKVYRRPAPDLCVEFCQKHGIEPREHGLAYEFYFPSWLYDASVEEIKEELEKRYAEVAKRYAGTMPTIEVTNEMCWLKGKTKIYDEPDYVEWCFKLAEKYFPNNQLCINDFTRYSWRDGGRTTDRYYAYIEANMLRGARIDAIGMQYHLFHKPEELYEKTRQLLDPRQLYKHMDLYGRFGKPLQITEVTVPAYSWEEEDELLQAETIEWLYSVWFSHPNVEQIIYWNLVDGYAHFWDPDPAKIKASQGNMAIGENVYYGGLLRFDLSPKPAYFKIKELLQQRWHTETEVQTDESGVLSFRGFYGEYELEIRMGDRTVTRTVQLSSKSDNTITLTV